MKTTSLHFAALGAAVGLLISATPSQAVDYSYAGTNEYWGTTANWNAAPPNGVDTTARMVTSGVMLRNLRLANSAGVDTSYTVGTFTFGGPTGGAGGQVYRLNNVTSGTARLIFDRTSGNASLVYEELFASVTMALDAGVTLNDNLSINVKGTVGAYQINGQISSGVAGTGITLTGTGTLQVGGANNYSGTTTINNGRLQLITDNDRLPTGTTVSIATPGRLDLNTRNQTIDRLVGSGTVINSGTGTGTSVLTVSSTVNSGTFAGVIRNGATAKTALTKGGTGTTLELTGTNLYTGATTVNAGTLLVNGSLGNSATTVNNGGTLAGTGSLGGAVSVNSGGVLAPGAGGIQSLDTGSVSFANNATFALEVNTNLGTIDLLNVTGNLSITGGAILTLTDLGTNVALNTTLTIIDYSGTWDGGLFNYAGNALADGGTFTLGANNYTIDYNNGSSVTLAVSAVPEPTTIALIGLALGGLAAARRCRRA